MAYPSNLISDDIIATSYSCRYTSTTSWMYQIAIEGYSNARITIRALVIYSHCDHSIATGEAMQVVD